jgi:hypothetical protein
MRILRQISAIANNADSLLTGTLWCKCLGGGGHSRSHIGHLPSRIDQGDFDPRIHCTGRQLLRQPKCSFSVRHDGNLTAAFWPVHQQAHCFAEAFPQA